jgi:hypothetical protein
VLIVTVWIDGVTAVKTFILPSFDTKPAHEKPGLTLRVSPPPRLPTKVPGTQSL